MEYKQLRIYRKLTALVIALAIAGVIGCGSTESSTTTSAAQPTQPSATTAPSTPLDPTPENAASCCDDDQGQKGTQGSGQHTPPGSGGSGANRTGTGIPGMNAFTELGCNACHSTGTDTLIGPGLAKIASRADDAYIEQSIRDPGAVIVEGFPNVMPATFADIPEPGMNNLISYLKTLG